MSKICVTTNISISTCNHLTQSEQMDFSKNGVFHSKCVVIFFQNDQNEIPTLPLPVKTFGILSERNSKDCNFTPFYSITAENILKSSKSKFLKIFCLRKFWTSKPILVIVRIRDIKFYFACPNLVW